MSQEDVENTCHAYAVLNQSYKSGDLEPFRRVLEQSWDSDAVFTPAGILPESAPVRGPSGVIDFIAEQMKAFRPGTMWLEPLEYIDGDDVMVVPYRFGGRAAYTDLDVAFEFAHVIVRRGEKVVRMDVYPTKEQALEAAGLRRPARPADVVRASWDALEAGGLEAMAALWHPEIEWRAVEGAVDDVGIFRGSERMRAYYTDWLATFDELHTEVESVLCEKGSVVAVVIRTRARPRGTSGWARGRYAVVYTVRNGLVVRGREYASPEDALAAAGLTS